MIVEKRQLLFVEMRINGKYKTFKLTVPYHMEMKELWELLEKNYKDFDNIEGTQLSDQFQNDIKVNRVERDIPVLSLIPPE
jgi:hypothetical protein